LLLYEEGSQSNHPLRDNKPIRSQKEAGVSPTPLSTIYEGESEGEVSGGDKEEE
jgi:hypothetical protein